MRLRQQSAGGALLQNLHHRGRVSDLWFGDHQMNVFGHDNVSHHHHETVMLAGLFENRKKAVAAAFGAQKKLIGDSTSK
jgi:hypothetical protein